MLFAGIFSFWNKFMNYFPFGTSSPSTFNQHMQWKTLAVRRELQLQDARVSSTRGILRVFYCAWGEEDSGGHVL